MKIESVNVGQARMIAGHERKTGIVKEPVAGPVHAGTLGLEGDAICDLKHHGGKDQAVYVYMAEDYHWWEGELQTPLLPGTFGENLTASGFSSLGVSAGDRFSCGTLVLEVTSPRIPCNVFGARMAMTGFPDRFMKARRSGFYCRVISEGPVATGYVFKRAPFAGETVTIEEMMRDYPYRRITEDTRARYLAAPIHHRMAEYLRGERAKP